MAATEKQTEFLATLTRKAAASLRGTFDTYKSGTHDRKMAVAQYLLLREMPEPQTTQEASEQIDALKDVGLLDYARKHQAWAQPILARGAALFGDDMGRLPETWDAVVAMIEAQG